MGLAMEKVKRLKRKLWTTFLEEELSPVYAFAALEYERWWNLALRRRRATNPGGGARGPIMNCLPDVLANP